MQILTDTQKVTLTIDPRTKATPANPNGLPAPVDGVPEWSSSNPAVASVTPAADGLSAVVVATATGTTQISVTADADLDVGETRSITGTLDVEVKASEAVTMGILTGTPEEQ